MLNYNPKAKSLAADTPVIVETMIAQLSEALGNPSFTGDGGDLIATGSAAGNKLHWEMLLTLVARRGEAYTELKSNYDEVVADYDAIQRVALGHDESEYFGEYQDQILQAFRELDAWNLEARKFREDAEVVMTGLRNQSRDTYGKVLAALRERKVMLHEEHERIANPPALKTSPTMTPAGYDTATKVRIAQDLYNASRELLWDFVQTQDADVRHHALAMVLDTVAAGIDGHEHWTEIMERSLASITVVMTTWEEHGTEVDELIAEVVDAARALVYHDEDADPHQVEFGNDWNRMDAAVKKLDEVCA